ncbi:MAG: ABC transporter permease [Deltaproteobacteria bacterium]|nr:ABC transporter permease [Deltaproteobacteria bacterium]
MNLTWKHGAAVSMFVIAFHTVLALLPEPPFTVSMNLVLAATNLYVAYCAGTILRRRTTKALATFLVGYAALYLLTMVLLGKKPLFILLVVAYSSLFASPVLVGFFALFVLCFVVLQPYAFETFVPLSLVYAILVRLRRQASRFALACLGLGLVALIAVLFPILHLAVQDSVQTLLHALGRADVQEALGLSLLTSTLATLLVAVWGVPFAWALSRLEFPGKRWVESLVDLPILVPQSVAGVALLVLFGPGSPLGQGLESMGLPISGTLFALLLAQVFVASPFVIKTAMTAFEGVPVQLEHASRTLGASPAATFLRVSLPLAARGIVVGAALGWARAISEFGIIVLFAPSPVTAPMLVHTEFLRAGAFESRPIAVLLLVTCLWFFVVLRFAGTLVPFGLGRQPREARS